MKEQFAQQRYLRVNVIDVVYDKLQKQFAQRSYARVNALDLVYDKLQEQFAQRSCPQGKPHGCGL